MVTPLQANEQPITPTNIPGTNNRPKLPMRPDAAGSEDLNNGGDVIRTYTSRDVLNGRGQGVQRHPGNVKYRTLVFVNKTLYAKCPRNDKIKISRGIVAAVRQFGGRFLDLDERTNIYTDIGDKKATEKTSQALREGQTKIRQDAYKNKDTGMQPTLPAPPVSADGKWEISGEGYLEYSNQVLHELYKAEDNMTPEMAARPAPHSVATQLGLGTQKRKEHRNKGGRIVSSDSMIPVLPPIVSAPGVASAQHVISAPSVPSAHMADQFDGMVPVQQQQQQATMHPNMPPPPNLPRPAISSSGSPLPTQVTDISRLSLSELLRLSANGERGTADSFTTQLMELVRQSNSELMQTGLSRDNSSIRFNGLGDEILPNKDDGAARPTESTTSSGLMQRDTLLSFAPNEELSRPSAAAHLGQQQEPARLSSDRMSIMSVDSDANDVAQMLIRLSRDSDKKSEGAMQMEI